jgi:hypothetical protein
VRENLSEVARSRADSRFADTFCRCWKFGQAEQPENANQFDTLRRELHATPRT